MGDLVWIVIVVFLIALILRLNKDKELQISKMPKKEREKMLKEREKFQKKNIRELWIVLGVIILIAFLFILIICLIS